MILYQLRCATGHEFEGWFLSSSAFEDQSRRGLLSCPFCGTASVDRALMAPAVHSVRDGKKAVPAEAAPEPEPKEAAVPEVSAPAEAAPLPDAVVAVLSRLREKVEASCENVGSRFTEEALRIHRGESDERGIYGTMSEDQREILEDEGVDVLAVPWVRRSDS